MTYSSVSRVLRYLFAALSKADSQTLTRKELPDRGGLAQQQPRFVACGQRMELERMSQLLNLLQTVSPFTHAPKLPVYHLHVTVYSLHRLCTSQVRSEVNCSKNVLQLDLYRDDE